MSSYVAEASGNLDAAQSADGRVKDDPRGNFQLMVHPLDWQLDVRGRLVPVVVQIGKEVGNGSVSTRGNFNQHRLEHEANGFVMIPHDVLGPARDYVDVYRNQRGRKVHRTVFERPSPGQDATIWGMDVTSWYKFLDLLRLRGIVKQPQASVVRELLNTRRWLYADKTKRGPRNSTTEAVERYEREMAALREVIVHLELELAKSIETYGDDASPVASDLDALLDVELASASAVANVQRSIAAAPASRKARGPRAEKPKPPKAELAADGEIDGDTVEDDE